MNFSKSLSATSIALGLAMTSCNEKSSQGVQNATAQGVTDTLSYDWMSSPENQNLFRLYQLVDRGEKTTEYFRNLCAYYESQGHDSELSGRLADVMARILTLRDLVETRTIAPNDLRDILVNNIVISGIHESNYQPLIIAETEGDINDFFDTLEPTSTIGVVLNSEEKLVFSNGNKRLMLSTTHGQVE